MKGAEDVKYKVKLTRYEVQGAELRYRGQGFLNSACPGAT